MICATRRRESWINKIKASFRLLSACGNQMGSNIYSFSISLLFGAHIIFDLVRRLDRLKLQKPRLPLKCSTSFARAASKKAMPTTSRIQHDFDLF